MKFQSKCIEINTVVEERLTLNKNILGLIPYLFLKCWDWANNLTKCYYIHISAMIYRCKQVIKPKPTSGGTFFSEIFSSSCFTGSCFTSTSWGTGSAELSTFTGCLATTWISGSGKDLSWVVHFYYIISHFKWQSLYDISAKNGIKS